MISVTQLSKHIQGKEVLRSISFQVEHPQAIAICGHNGSGKSTLLKLLAGLLSSTSGEIARSTNRIGYVPEHFPEQLRFTVKEYLELVASIQGLSQGNRETELASYIQPFGLKPFLHTPLKQCSKGTKQKVGLIQALVGKPELLLLDEPLTGLDDETCGVLMDRLGQLKKTTLIFFSTHEEILLDRLADQIWYLEGGQLKQSVAKIEMQRQIRVKYPTMDAIEPFPVIEVDPERNIATLSVDAAQSDHLLAQLLQNGCSIIEVIEKRPI